MKINKYVTYTRVSTKSQGKSGLGIAAQESLLNHYLSDEDIVKRFTETASAKNLDERPVLQEAIAYCLEHGYGLAVAKVDRLSRITEHALEVFSKLNGMLYSCDIPCTKFAPMDKFSLTMFMAIADRERELIGIRTKQALAERYANESWSKSHKNNTFTKEAKAAAAAARTAKALKENKEIFCLIKMLKKDKKSTNVSIAQNLTDEGYRTKRGNEYTAISVQRIYKAGMAARTDCTETEL